MTPESGLKLFCKQCGDVIPNGSFRREYCGITCRNRAFALRQRKFHPRPCPVCGKDSRGPAITCSPACGYKFRKLRARRQKECPICKAVFWPKKQRGGIWSKYCSKACYDAKASERLAMKRVFCEQCGREFRRTAGAIKRVKLVFCNKLCCSKFMTRENHPNWRGGHDPNRGPDWLKLAETIRARDEYRCRRCGRTQEENGQKLDVDHIVPWRLFPGRPDVANEPSNLVALCRRCHRIKTATSERAYLVGDCIGMSQYEESISLPPLFGHYGRDGR